MRMPLLPNSTPSLHPFKPSSRARPPRKQKPLLISANAIHLETMVYRCLFSCVFVSKSIPNPPCPLTIPSRHAHHLDITTLPSRLFFWVGGLDVASIGCQPTPNAFQVSPQVISSPYSIVCPFPGCCGVLWGLTRCTPLSHQPQHSISTPAAPFNGSWRTFRPPPRVREVLDK
jgi:hypothetical protein